MAVSTLPAQQTTSDTAHGLTWPMAWRNLWRNRRRTWLTAGGVAFATLLVTMAMALQAGSYGSMIDNATSLFNGHAEISRVDYIDDSKLEQTIGRATETMRSLEEMQGVSAAPRVQSFVLASIGERSYGGLIYGVDFAAEQKVVDFFERIIDGDLPVESDEVLIGEGQ